MTIVGFLKVLGFCVLNLMISGTIGFGGALLCTMVLSWFRKGKPLPDSYYDGVPRAILFITVASIVLLSIFGPFKVV